MNRRVAEPASVKADAPVPSADRLVAATTLLIGAGPCERARFGIAVSGGPDSVALLLLANAAFPGRIAAATVDHRLRPGSADEAAMVATLCADHRIVHTILTPANAITGSVQAAARQARYTLLEQWRTAHGLDWLMTAHHADDQLETLIMRLNRASGVAGLSGIRARQGKVLRPLLHERHAALATWLRARGVTAIIDPSNNDPRFDRTRVRTALSAQPSSGTSIIDPLAAVDSMAWLADADAAIVWMTETLAIDRITPAVNGGVLLDHATLPTELVRRLLCHALAVVDADAAPPRGPALTAAIAGLHEGKQVMLGDIIVRNDPRTSGHWLMFMAPLRR